MFSERFRTRLSAGKYSNWAVNLDEDTVQVILWAIGEIGMRAGLPRAAAHAVEVPTPGGASARVAVGIQKLVEILWGERTDLDQFGSEALPLFAAPLSKPVALVRRVQESEVRSSIITWLAPIDDSRVWFESLPRSEVHAIVSVLWRERPSSRIHPVGTFQLDLGGLVEEGYVREDETGALRFQLIRDKDGVVYIVGEGGRFPLGLPLDTVETIAP